MSRERYQRRATKMVGEQMAEALTLESLHNEIMKLKAEVEEIKRDLIENLELSDWAKKRLRAYEAGEEKIVGHEKVRREISE